MPKTDDSAADVLQKYYPTSSNRIYWKLKSPKKTVIPLRTSFKKCQRPSQLILPTPLKIGDSAADVLQKCYPANSKRIYGKVKALQKSMIPLRTSFKKCQPPSRPPLPTPLKIGDSAADVLRKCYPAGSKRIYGKVKALRKPMIPLRTSFEKCFPGKFLKPTAT